MIKLHFLDSENKPNSMEIHAGIIHQFRFIDNSLMIEFKRSIKTLPQNSKKTDKKKNEVFTNWIWTKNVNDIINYDEVIRFLKSLNIVGSSNVPPTNSQNKDIQQSLF